MTSIMWGAERRTSNIPVKGYQFVITAIGELIITEVRTMVDQMQKYEKYVGFIRGLLVACGIWPLTIKHKALRIFYRQIPFLVLFCSLGMLYGAYNFCYDHFYNLGMLMKSVSVVVSTTIVILKVLFFLVYQREIREMIDILRGLVNEILKNPRFWPTVFSYFNLFYHSAYIIFYTVFCLCLTYSLTPHIRMFYMYMKDIEPRHCTFPYPTSFPGEIKNCGLLYMALTLMETLTSCVFVTVTPGVDTFFGYCMFQMSAVLKAMSYEFEHLTPENCEYVMQKCVEKHTQLLRCRNIIQEAFGAIVLLMSVTNALIICSLTFQAYKAEMTVVSAALFIFYLLLKLSQSYSYAWYGSVITNESEAFREAVYSSNWHVFGNKAFMRGVLIIMSQKPMTISAYNFFPISMELFIGIVNATVSYFFLLKTLEEAIGVDS